MHISIRKTLNLNLYQLIYDGKDFEMVKFESEVHKENYNQLVDLYCGERRVTITIGE